MLLGGQSRASASLGRKPHYFVVEVRGGDRIVAEQRLERGSPRRLPLPRERLDDLVAAPTPENLERLAHLLAAGTLCVPTLRQHAPTADGGRGATAQAIRDVLEAVHLAEEVRLDLFGFDEHHTRWTEDGA